MRLVIVESPYHAKHADGSKDEATLARNQAYLERALRDCVYREESPYASHKMLTTCLNDYDPAERELGIRAGLAWKRLLDIYTVFYTDYGFSSGMRMARDVLKERGIPYSVRLIGQNDRPSHPDNRISVIFRADGLSLPELESNAVG